MKALRDDSGYTLIETLVATLLLSIVTTGFYMVLFSGTRGSQTSQEVTRVAQEARSGLNRLIRDTREADSLSSASESSYNVKIDFDGDGSYQNPNGAGDYENLTFTYHAVSETIRLNGEVLIKGVEKVAGRPIFSFSSNALEYDFDNNGITTLEELRAAGANGYSVPAPGTEETFISSVTFEFNVNDGDATTDFYGEAQLRNRR
jgi:prepilin-type N-terminal cleavage/methylation domain-containing protein